MIGKMQPKYSIIVPHYDGAISDEKFIRGMTCLKNQPFKNFEVLIYHDGPTSRPIPDVGLENSKIKVTQKRYNDWGHSLRDMGIRDANGEYIIHFNPDNILYENALDRIEDILTLEVEILSSKKEIVIFPIRMMGVVSNGHYYCRFKELEDMVQIILTGSPTIKHNIDCMQLVMKKDIWVKEGGWKDKTEQSDGNMYPYFVKKYGARYCYDILGEHR